MDLLTLSIVNGTIALAFIAIMARLAQLNPAHRYFCYWTVAGVCLLINAAVGGLSDLVSVPYVLMPALTNSAIALMHLCFLTGVCLWLHRPVPKVAMLVWFLLFVGWLLTPLAQQHTVARIGVHMLLVMVCSIYSFYLVWRFAKASISRQLFLFAFGFNSCQFAVRAIVLGIDLHTSDPSGQLNVLQHITHQLGWFALTTFILAMLAATISCYAQDIWFDLRQQAHTDALTGLFNRHGLLPRLQKLLQITKQQQTPLTMAILDLDHFKHLNDHYGHPVGDRVLQWLGQQMKYHFREQDLLVRLGGEEFLLVLPGLDQHSSQLKLESLRLLIHQQRFLDLPDLQLSASVGALVLPANALQHPNPDHWLAQADAALYQAKAAGRNQLTFATTNLA